jgi:hypothetical protein
MNVEDFWHMMPFKLVNSYQLLLTDTASYCRRLESAVEPHISTLTLIAFASGSSQFQKFNHYTTENYA